MKSIALVVVAAFLVCACKHYPSTIRLTPDAESRRLSQGQSDRVEGVITHSDATYVYVDARGVPDKVERKDIASIKNGAGKAIMWGGVAIGAGLLVTVISAAFFQCDQGEFPLACPFTHGKDNLWAGLGFIAGIAITFQGVKMLFSGMADKARVERALSASAAKLQLTSDGVGFAFGF